MSEQQQTPKFHKWFHNFLIYFAMWAFAVIALIQGFLEIQFTMENGVHPAWPVIVLAVLMMLVGLFLIKTRFDLAKFRPQAPKEMLIVCLAAAVILALIAWIMDATGADDPWQRLRSAGIVAIWGFVLYRYYNDRPYLFAQE